MDPDTIPTEPTTDIEPPATAVVTGPSLASTSPAAGRGRGSMIHRAAIGLALVLTFSVGIGVGLLAMPALGTVGTTTPSPTGSAATADFGLIREAWDVLHSKYVGADELNDKELIYGAINGMTEAVGDTGHTSFLTPEERASRANDLSGQYVGIGVRIDTAEDGLPLIIGVFPDSPAEKAGLAVGDEIVAVDGKPTTGHTIDDVVTWVRGEAGSSVVVTVRPGAKGKEREVSMIRAAVAVDPVSWTLVPGTKTALIRLDQFSTGAADDLKKALGQAREAGADRLVLDLRGNPGGYVNEADAVASQFLKSGTVFVERGADGKETTHPVTPGGVGNRPAAHRARRRRDGQLVRDRVGRHPGRRPGPDRRDQDVRDRDGPRRVPAHRRVGPAGRHGRVADPQRPPDLARGDHPGCRRRARHRCRAARSRGSRQADPGRGRRDQGSAARPRPEPRRRRLGARPAADR